MEALVDCVVELAGGPGRTVWVIEADGGDGAILIGELLSRDELVATLTPTEVAARGRVAATEQAETAVRTAMRGEPRAAVHQAMRHAVRDAVFLVDLVIRLNLEVEKSIRIEGLRYAPLFWEMRAIAAEAELETGPQGRRCAPVRLVAFNSHPDTMT